MASGKTLQSTIEISGVLSPSLQATINKAVSKLSDMAEETLDSADAASRLAAEMSEQENVLNALKRAYAGYAVEGKESSEEAQKLAQKIEDVSGELNENKQKLDAAERAANSFGNELDEAEDKAEKASDGFTVMKGVLSNLVTKGLELAAEGVRKLYDSYMEFDNGADTVIAKTGATGKAAESLQKVYKNVSKSVPGSFEDIGTAVGEINTRFGLTDGALEDLSVKFMKFAELNDTDVNSSVDNVQKALSAFGLDANEAGGVLDTLNKVGQDSGIAMDKLSTSLIENASSFSQMGLDIHQAAGFMGQIEKSGVTTEVAMTALGKASQFAAKENKPLTQMLEETTQKMANAKTDTEGLQVAYEVFGKKAGAKIYEACKTGSLSFDDLAKAMENNSGSIDSTYEATQDGADKIKLALQGVKADAGEAIAGFLDEHKDEIVSTIETITGGIKTISDNLPVVGVIIGGVTAAITAFKLAALSAKLATEGFTIATKLQSIAQGALNAIMNANPIGLIILGITALVATFMILWNNCEGFRNFWIGLWEGIKNAVSVAVEWIKSCWDRIKAFFTGDSVIAQYFQTVWNNIKIVWDIAVSYFKTLWENIKLVFSAVKSVLSGDFSGAWESIKKIFANWGTFFSGLWDKVKQIFANVGGFFASAFGGVWEKIKSIFAPVGEFFATAWETIKNVVTVGLMFIKTLIVGYFQLITLPFRFIWENCKDTIIAAWNAIKEKVTTALNAVKSIISSVWNAIKGVITPIITAIVDFVKQRWENLKNNVMTVFNTVKSIATTVWNGIKTSISNVVNGIRNTISTVFESVKSKVSSVFNGIKSVATSVWNGIKSAITTPINAAKDAVTTAIEKIKSAFNFSWKLPDLKLPHISVSGGKAPYGIGGKGTLPSFSVEWYKDGGILTDATIFGMAGGNLLGGGEAGAEAVVPLKVLWNKLDTLIHEVFNSATSTGEPSGEGLTATAGKLLTLDDFSLGSLADSGGPVIYYDFSGFTWSPQIQTNGSGDADDFMAQLKAHEAEFFDWLEEFIHMREEAQYA